MMGTKARKKAEQVTRSVPVREFGGKTVGEVELPGEIFDAPASIPLLHQVVIAQQAAKRAGTHSTKTRGEVRGGGRKPYRQKGTGRARQGSVRAPQFTGGGTVHGPKPRDYSQRTPKKMIRAAIRGALTDRARNDRIHVVSELICGQTPSTKTAKAFLAELSERKKFLLVLGREDVTGWRSARNLPGVHVLEPGQINAYDVLDSDEVVFSVSALHTFVHGPTESAQDTATGEEDQ